MKYAFIVVSSLVVCACGGGGGGTESNQVATAKVSSTLSFPLRQAYRNLNASGGSFTFNGNGTAATESVDGLCSGTFATSTNAATNSTTFEGGAALSAAQTDLVTYTNCTPNSSTFTGTNYYTVNYEQMGFVDSTTYSVYASLVVPATVMVGNTDAAGVVNVYSDITKTAQRSRRDLSYVIEPDTATTAIVNLISKNYWQHGATGYACNTYNGSFVDATYPSVLYSTAQSRYRIDSTGSLTPISIDVQTLTTCGYPGTTTTQHHFVWRK